MEIIKGVFVGDNSILVKKTDFDEMFNISGDVYLTYSDGDDFGVVLNFIRIPKFEEKNGMFYSERRIEFVYKKVSYEKLKEKLKIDTEKSFRFWTRLILLSDGEFKLCGHDRFRLEYDKLKKDIYYCIEIKPNIERKFNKI